MSTQEKFQYRTQFDSQLLHANIESTNLIHGHRQCLALNDGTVITALASNGEAPVLHLWRDYQHIAEIPLEGQSGAPQLLGNNWDDATLWLAIDDEIFSTPIEKPALQKISKLHGSLGDVVMLAEGTTVLALTSDDCLTLVLLQGDTINTIDIDDGVGRCCLEIDSKSNLHLAYEKQQGIEYRRFGASIATGNWRPQIAERPAEAFGFHPALLAVDDKILLVYQGESCRPPSYKRWGDAWERLGRGGYIGALVRDRDGWRRYRLADSQQRVKPLRPIDTAFGGGPEVEMRVRLDMFAPPVIALGPDGVPQVLWANTERRWIYASRFLGSEFSPAVEIRGPLEQLRNCFAPRRVPATYAGLPIAMITKTRAHLDSLALPSRHIEQVKRVDFLQADELAESHGMEIVVNQMRRHARNPIIARGEPGERDDGGIISDVFHENGAWRAELSYIKILPPAEPHQQPRGSTWHHDGLACSRDGIEWTKLNPVPLADRYSVDGKAEHQYTIRFLRDDEEASPAWRYKGFWRAQDAGPWGWVSVVSHDGKCWKSMRENNAVINADDDLRIWRDEYDIPARRFKACSISRGFCGRISCQWVSADGVYWQDERETLDFNDPFGSKPDKGTTGRILLDSWAGPDDEDEIHGGFIFRDGDRWLLHYMKWTADGHIYLALASSRDGINFSRVDGGAVTLPLGEAGTWDAGRVAIREAPFPVDGIWRQYYTGCGWKHGLAGMGAKTSPVGINAPNQVGIAEIESGHWAHVRVSREAGQGKMRTIAYSIDTPSVLTLDVAGLEKGGQTLTCALIDTASGTALPGFDFTDCDPIVKNGRAVSVTWKGRAEFTGNVAICLSLQGYGIQLYGLNLHPRSPTVE